MVCDLVGRISVSAIRHYLVDGASLIHPTHNILIDAKRLHG
ncbi:hypothetical protein [Dryocola sp. BD613]